MSPLAARAADPTRRAWVRHLMGMPVSVHVRGPRADDPAVDRAVEDAFASLRHTDDLFSTYRAGTPLDLLRRGRLALADAPAELLEVHRLCLDALDRTGGYVDAWGWTDGFDPTGLVKGWAVDRAHALLAPLARTGCSTAVDAGGDLRVATAEDDAAGWTVGVEDPRDRTRVLARVPLRDGAVATSGTAARGTHIVDPWTGAPATAVLSATVVAATALRADLHATELVARGRDALTRTHELDGTAGVLVTAAGEVHRWGADAPGRAGSTPSADPDEHPGGPSRVAPRSPGARS